MLLTAAVVIPPLVGDLRAIDATHVHRATWPRLEATVGADYQPGRHTVPLSYRHPVTAQDVDVEVVVVHASLLPAAAGAAFEVGVDPGNPDVVVVPGDGDPLRDVTLFPLLVVGLAIAASMARWWAVWRSERLVRSDRTAFAMLAAMTTSSWRPRRVRCSLYPIDARPGTRPVCTFDVLTTSGVPIGGAAFPVEVRGRPVPGGLLVARSGERIIRPVRRPLTRGGLAFAGATFGEPPALPVAPAPPPDTTVVAPFTRCLGVLAPLCAAAMMLATVIAVPRIVVGNRDSAELARSGMPVLAEVVGNDAGNLVVRYTPPGTSASVEGTTFGAESHPLGRLYPAHADSDGHVQLDADPYSATAPIVSLVVGWVVVALLAWPRLRWRRDARRAARRGPWSLAVAVPAAGNVRVALPTALDGSFVAECAATWTMSTAPLVLVAGSLDPGDGVAVAGAVTGCGPPRRTSLPRPSLAVRDRPRGSQRSA